MQPSKKVTEKKIKREQSKDDLTSKKLDEKPKKSVYSVSTPRSFVQKSSTADIYARKTNALGVKAPKKAPALIKNSDVSPMKNLLKSSSSSVSQISTRSNKTPIKSTRGSSAIPNSARYTEKSKSKITNVGAANKKLPFTNVTVNSPIAKRKLNLEYEDEAVEHVNTDKDRNNKEVKSKNIKSKEVLTKEVELVPRQRTKTRTLDEAEVKVLTPDVVDNNIGMQNLTKTLSAQPKAFFVDLNEKKPEKQKGNSSEEEVNYEDDFESYESDFESYHSERLSGEQSDTDKQSDELSEPDKHSEELEETDHETSDVKKLENYEEGNSKEEKMLDSGNFELRDRSATKSRPMDFIMEDPGGDKKVSLTDEGFQEMSSSSGLSSMRTLHVDVLERPLFIDFTKSKENKRKRRIFEKLKQRAEDILSMVTLHEMSYNLFEMKPIPYDLYMATFGRHNYIQTAAQTFDDGITGEVQTEKVLVDTKWTQHPVEFSNEDVYLNEEKNSNNNNSVDDLWKFTFLTEHHLETDNNDINNDESYKKDPLRIYFEQKDGVGSDKFLPYEKYKIKLKSDNYNINRLQRFLKKTESRISNILSVNVGNTELSNLIKTSKFSFSKGYLSISAKEFADEKYSFLKGSTIIGVIFSDTKHNLLVTVHNKLATNFSSKCVLCLWDLSIARREPMKILLATDNVKIGRLTGGTEGYLVAALQDGTIHLWDLTEGPTWCNDVASEDISTKTVEIQSEHLTQSEIDREWNLKNSNVSQNKHQQFMLQACAYTTSAMNVRDGEMSNHIVGLEFINQSSVNLENGRKIISQICSLQSVGILTIWSILQEKSKDDIPDIGKAYWSKMKLQKSQTINLLDQFHSQTNYSEAEFNFDLNAAKRRTANKRQDKNIMNKDSRPKSAIGSKFKSDRPNSVASLKKKNVSVENECLWERCIVCNHLKIMTLNNVVNFLIGKNCGEVLCCRRILGSVVINGFRVANSASSVTRIETSPHNLPYFLAATDCGTVNMCSLLDHRVLLTLDIRNGPSPVMEKCQSDHKGRFVASVNVKNDSGQFFLDSKLSISSIYWSHSNPFCIVATHDTSVCVWELTHSDIRAKSHYDNCAVCCEAVGQSMALLAPDGEVQVYTLTDKIDNRLELFERYVTLL